MQTMSCFDFGDYHTRRLNSDFKCLTMNQPTLTNSKLLEESNNKIIIKKSIDIVLVFYLLLCLKNIIIKFNSNRFENLYCVYSPHFTILSN